MVNTNISGKLKRAHLTKSYARYRLEEPSHFQKGSFRTLDVGRKGHTKVVIARPIGKSTTQTQAVLVARKDYEKGYRPDLGNPSKKKLLAYSKEEAKTAKGYAKEGFEEQAEDEAKHSRFFKKKATMR